MALHFTREEPADRRKHAVELMQKRGLDGLRMFRQESMYYLTGHATFGYAFFPVPVGSARPLSPIRPDE